MTAQNEELRLTKEEIYAVNDSTPTFAKYSDALRAVADAATDKALNNIYNLFGGQSNFEAVLQEYQERNRANIESIKRRL